MKPPRTSSVDGESFFGSRTDWSGPEPIWDQPRFNFPFSEPDAEPTVELLELPAHYPEESTVDWAARTSHSHGVTPIEIDRSAKRLIMVGSMLVLAVAAVWVGLDATAPLSREPVLEGVTILSQPDQATTVTTVAPQRAAAGSGGDLLPPVTVPIQPTAGVNPTPPPSLTVPVTEPLAVAPTTVTTAAPATQAPATPATAAPATVAPTAPPTTAAPTTQAPATSPDTTTITTATTQAPSTTAPPSTAPTTTSTPDVEKGVDNQ